MNLVEPPEEECVDFEAVDMIQRLVATGDMLRRAWSQHLCTPDDADLAERNRRFMECMRQSGEWGDLAQESCYRWGVVRGSVFYDVAPLDNDTALDKNDRDFV